MTRMLFVLALCLVGCGGGSTTASQWDGSWKLASVDGIPMPGTVVRSGITYQIADRTLLVTGTSGLWVNTTTVIINGTSYNQGGSATYTISTTGSTLTATRNASGVIGATDPVLTFAMQTDGSLRETGVDGVYVFKK